MAGAMSFTQYGNKLIRNPAQRIPASRSIPGLQRMATRIAPELETAGAKAGVIPVLGKMLGVYGKVAPLTTNIKMGYDLANNILERMGMGSWAHPKQAS